MAFTGPRSALKSPYSVVPTHLAAGLGKLNTRGGPLFRWDNKLTRTHKGLWYGNIHYNHWLLGLAYLKPARDGCPSCQPVSGSESSVGPRSGVRVGGWPMAELCNFETEQATHGKFWYGQELAFDG